MEKLMLRSSAFSILIFVFFGIGCTPDFEGSYSDPSKAEIVDDRWNETDARRTAEHLVASCLSKPWLLNFASRAKTKRPVVIVDEVENRTDEHIDTRALTEFVRDELINSGKVRFLNESRRKQILAEIKYQNSGAVSADTRKSAGRQIGADFMIGGAISSSVHTQGGYKTVTYQSNLILTNLETSEIEWSEKKLIKKKFRRSGSSF